MRDLAKKILKYKHGGESKDYKDGGEADWKKELDSEIDGLSEEAKEYVLKRLQGKKVSLSDEEYVDVDREKLDDEIEHMSDKGRKYFKHELKEDLDEDDKEKKDPWKDVKEELDDKEEDKESIGELMAYSEEGYAKGGAVHHPTDVTPPDLWKGKRKKDEEDKYCPSKDEEYAQGGEAKNWIQGAVKKPGALRAVAAKEGMIKGDEKLSSKDLNRLAAQARKKDNKLLAKRVSLAKTFAKMRKK